MKKIIMALMCISMSLAMSAQPKNDKKDFQNKPNAGKNFRPQHRNHGMAGMCQCQQQCPCGMPQMRNRQINAARPGMNDMVVNMRAIKSLGLDSTTVNAVKELKKQKTGEMRSIRMAMRPSRPIANAPQNDKGKAIEKKGKKADKKQVKKGGKSADNKVNAPTSEERKAMREQFMAKMKENRQKMQACTKSYRAELRKILGDEKYIEYLEKLTSQRQQPQNFRQQRPRRQYRG